jgi:LuxR family quorum-sensing system transcriptional regulator CciR
MQIGPELSLFISRSTQAQSEAEISTLLAEAGFLLGLPKFALVSHVDLLAEGSQAIAISNYPGDWIDRILKERYYLDDPLHAASTRVRMGLAWHDASKLVQLTARQTAILAEAQTFGLFDGVTIPVHSPGEFRGTCSFGGSEPVLVTPHLLAVVHLIAVFAFQAARRVIHRGAYLSRPQVPLLSPRHVKCVGMAATGLGDKQIGHRLELAQDTVHKYFQEAMGRYGINKRSVLILRAMFDGQICYHNAA